MKETDESIINKIIGTLFRDTIILQNQGPFITHTCSADRFIHSVKQDKFHELTDLLSTATYNGNPFVKSVKCIDNGLTMGKHKYTYKITVHNPRVKK